MICEHCKGGEGQDHSKCPGGTWCDCGHPKAEVAKPQESDDRRAHPRGERPPTEDERKGLVMHGLTQRGKQEDEARERQVDVHVLTWDWKENAPLDVISRMINDMPTAFMYEVDTGEDYFALVISPIALDQGEVKVAFAATRSSWGLDEEDKD